MVWSNLFDSEGCNICHDNVGRINRKQIVTDRNSISYTENGEILELSGFIFVKKNTRTLNFHKEHTVLWNVIFKKHRKKYIPKIRDGEHFNHWEDIPHLMTTHSKNRQFCHGKYFPKAPLSIVKPSCINTRRLDNRGRCPPKVLSRDKIVLRMYRHQMWDVLPMIIKKCM